MQLSTAKALAAEFAKNRPDDTDIPMSCLWASMIFAAKDALPSRWAEQFEWACFHRGFWPAN